MLRKPQPSRSVMPTILRRAYGFPNQKLANKLEDYLKDRFAISPSPGLENAVQYANGVLDRQISKAAGLLSYNALLLGSFNLITRGGNVLTGPANFGLHRRVRYSR